MNDPIAKRIRRDREQHQAGRHDQAATVFHPQVPAHAVYSVRDADGSPIGESRDPGTAARFAASGAALHACDLLLAAYAEGEQRGGSVSWEMVDEAHQAALTAQKIAGNVPERPAGSFAERVSGAHGKGRRK